MSNKARCHVCSHLAGVRVAPYVPGELSKRAAPGKKSCGCVCHTVEKEAGA